MQIYHRISIDILSEVMNISEQKIRKIYRLVIQDECVPLSEIPIKYRYIYAYEYLLRDRVIDFPFLNAIRNYEEGAQYNNPDIQQLFNEMKMLREGLSISKQYASSGSSTERLKKLASQYGISYSTFARKRRSYMNSTALSRALMHDISNEDTVDRYRTCCFYCRDLIIFLHEKPGRISAAKIYRDIKKMTPFPCSRCPYSKQVKSGEHRKGDCIPAATCMRNSEYMITPNCDDTVCRVISNIPEQQDVLAWAGVRTWQGYFHFTPSRRKPDVINYVWFSDHKKLDIFVRTKRRADGTWEIRRPWITAIIDAASNVMVSYVLSLNPNSDCIAECFARACAFTVDTPYCGIPDYFYIDNGKDYRSKKLDGLPNNDEAPLYLNKEFGESGILEWFGIKVIHALPYRGCSKTIERIWKTIDDEWIKENPGYCGSSPDNRPFILDEQIKNNELYTFEQFADCFADVIYPGYNDLGITNEVPNDIYARLPKASSFVPTWRTLAVLKSVTAERVIRSQGIKYKSNYYWCSELGPLVEKDKTTHYRIFAFDTPFNRNISVVRDHQYIGEAHMIEQLNVVERRRHKVIEHIKEQQAQYKIYSQRLEVLHSIILQTDILKDVCSIPPVDNIRYGQAIDKNRDKESAHDDSSLPKELMDQAEYYNNALLNDDCDNSKGQFSSLLQSLGERLMKK